jgi:NitT/TauT family transport system substrate-binding protein
MAKINIMALRHSAFYAPLLMTIKGGFLQKQGLQPTYAVQTPDNLIVDNLQRGSAHLAQSAPAVNFAPLEQGEEPVMVHFASINQRDGFFLTARERPQTAFQWSDLENQPVLVDHLFQPHATLHYAMHLHGADFDRIEIIDAGNVDQMDQAFRAGRGAFVHQQGPAPQQLEADGLGFRVASVGEAIGPIAFSSLAATREWLETDMALAFMEAYRQAMQRLLEISAAEVAALIGEFLPGIATDVLVSTIDDYKRLDTWSEDVTIKPETFQTLLKVFLHSGYITREHPIEQCVVNL